MLSSIFQIEWSLERLNFLRKFSQLINGSVGTWIWYSEPKFSDFSIMLRSDFFFFSLTSTDIFYNFLISHDQKREAIHCMFNCIMAPFSPIVKESTFSSLCLNRYCIISPVFMTQGSNYYLWHTQICKAQYREQIRIWIRNLSTHEIHLVD